MKTAPQGKPTLPLASVLQRESLGGAVSQVTDYCERASPKQSQTVTPLKINASLHLQFDLQLAVAGDLDSFAAFQVAL
jgi:hypothetical protein